MSLLDGVTCIDIGFMVAAPGAARILGDLGATVIKVEPPTGDVGRRLLPLGEHSVMFENYNRGKRSVVIDLKTAGGREVLQDLVGEADLIVTNLRPKFLRESGVTWEFIHARNPAAVLAVVTTFGLDEDDSNAAGGDIVAQAESGLAFFNGQPGDAPLIAQNAPADVAVSMYAVISMLACLLDARRTGIGRLIDLSLTDVYTTLDVGVTPMVLASGGAFQPQPTGRFHPSFTPHGVYRGTAGYIVISAYGTGANSMWPRLATAIGKEELANDQRYATDADRLKRRDEITALIETWLAGFDDTDAAVSVLRQHGVIAATMRAPHEAVTAERSRRRGLARTIEYPSGATLDVIGVPARISGFEPALRPAPRLGADTISILTELLGYDQARIDALASDNSIRAGEGSATWTPTT
jgi:crotonobetainyl-CoA:carnitine CoA-transferase CaiB-like acyl-CoA transferase